MNHQHIIEEAVFDISFGSMQAARTQESGLGSFIQSRILPLADEVFSEISADGMISRIDTLVVDLGDISYSDFMSEIECRFRKKLKAALQEKLQSFTSSNFPNEGRISKVQAERGRLEDFLETGIIVGNTDHLATHTAEEMLLRVIRGDGAKLIEFLKTTPHRDSAVKRLAKQFSEPSLMELMQLFSPGQETPRENWTGAIWASWKVNLKGVTEREFRSLIWERLMHEQLKTGNNLADPKRFFGEIMKQVFIQYATTKNTHDGKTPQESQHEEPHSPKYPATQTGAEIKMLSAQEARNRIKAHLLRVNGTLENDFWRGIEAHAEKAQDESRYYQMVLDCLLNDRIIDLEVAVAASQGTGNSPLSGRESKPRPVWPSSSVGKGGREEGGSAGEIYVANAGMVLLSPYMPQLFGMLGLTENQKLKGEKAAERAIHLLQFVVNERCDSPEPMLFLNKIFCGVGTGVPIAREIEIEKMEKETIEGMLKAVIQQWTIIGETSLQGLRESFLQRGGRLQLKEDKWMLKVEQRGIDVLLDRLPWSFSVIKHPWMAQPIYVEWR